MTTRILPLIGGRSTEHDASVHSWFGLLADVERRAPALVIEELFFFTRDGAIRHHRGALPRSYEALAAGTPASFGDFLAIARDPARGYLFSLLHGNEGEDGAWQGVAEVCDLRGSFGSVFASSVSMNKWAQAILARDLCDGAVRIPRTFRIDRANAATAIPAALAALAGAPCILKPNRMGASLLTTRFDDPTAARLAAAVDEILTYDPDALLQEFVHGSEYTVGCIEDGATITSLPVIRVSTERGFLGHEEKHGGGPAPDVELYPTDTALTTALKRASERIFREIGFHLMCRFDFIVTAAGDVYFLEANAMPGLSLHSAFPRMLALVGLDRVDLVLASIRSTDTAAARRKVLPYVIH